MAEEIKLDENPVDALEEVRSQEEALNEELETRKVAERLGLEYIDLDNFEIDPELFRSIPVDLMFRYNFVPRHKTSTGLVVVVCDPTDVLTIDELELLLGTNIELCVGTQTAPLFLRELHPPPIVESSVVLLAKLHPPWFAWRRFGRRDMSLELDRVGATISNGIDERVCCPQASIVSLRHFANDQTRPPRRIRR